MQVLRRFTVVLILISLLIQVPIEAQDVERPSYSGADLLFIIDQSGSMGGTRYNGPEYWGLGNDEQDARFLGPQFGLERFSYFLDGLVTQDPPELNLALLSFGADTRLLLDWTYVDVTRPDWESAELPRLEDDISSSRYGQTNQGFTDFIGAFQRAEEIFRGAPIPPDGQQHLRVIVLLTDGAPCVPIDVTSPINCLDLASVDAIGHLERLRDRAIEAFPENYLIYVVGLDATDSFWPETAGKWQEVVCTVSMECAPNHVQQVRTSDELSQQFNFIVSDVMSRMTYATDYQPVEYPPGDFFVRPYQQSFVITIFKNQPAPLNNVQLIMPNGQAQSVVAVTGPNTIIENRRVDFPTPGPWTLQLQDTNNIDQIQVALNSISAGVMGDVVPLSQQYLPLAVTVSIVDSTGVVLPRYPENIYPLNVRVAVYDATEPDKRRRNQIDSFNLALNPNNPANTNIFVGNWLPQAAGNYELRTTVSYQDSNQGEFVLIADETIDNVSITATSFQWEGLSKGRVREGETLSVNLSLIDNAINAPVSQGLGELKLRVQLLDTNGLPQGEPRILDNIALEAGLISGETQVLEPGIYNLNVEVGKLDAAGNFQAFSNFSHQTGLEVADVLPIHLSIISPTDGEVVDAFLPRMGIPYWRNNPINISIEVRDIQNNLVSLAAATNNQVLKPNLVLQIGETHLDMTAQLLEVQTGIYQAVTEEIGFGEVLLTADVPVNNDVFVADYSWETSDDALDTHRQIREFTWFIVIYALIALGIILAFVAFAAFLWYSHQRRTRFPLKGRLIFRIEDSSVPGDAVTVGDYTLEQFNSNSKKFVSKDFTQSGSDFKELLVHTNDEQQAVEEGFIYIKRIVFKDGEVLTPNYILRRGDKFEHSKSMAGVIVRYIIEKDPWDGDSF